MKHIRKRTYTIHRLLTVSATRLKRLTGLMLENEFNIACVHAVMEECLGCTRANLTRHSKLLQVVHIVCFKSEEVQETMQALHHLCRAYYFR